MKTAVIATKCFNDYGIISWHLMEMNISEILVIKKNHIYSLMKKYSEENLNLPIQILDLHLSGSPLYDAEQEVRLLDLCDRLVVFWNGKQAGIAGLIKRAKDMGKEVSVVYSYPRSPRRFANAEVLP